MVRTMIAGSSGAASASASRARALLRLVRPVNGAVAGAAVVVGAWVARRPPQAAPALWGALAAFAAVSAANALNDVIDRDADRSKSRPRPVAAGLVTPGAATVVWAVGYAAALWIAVGLGARATMLVAIWIVLTVLYSLVLQKVPLVGNVVVSLVVSSTLLLGGLTQRLPVPAFVPFALAFFANLAREIVKDVEDADGDSRSGIETLAVTLGPRASLQVARVLVGTLGILAVIPAAAGVYGTGYTLVLVPLEAALLWLVVSMGGRAAPARPGLYSGTLKAVMVVGLAAVLAGVMTA